MLSSMDSWLAWRTVRLGISTASPVSVLLWMAPLSLRPSPSTNKKGEEAVSYCSQSLSQWQTQGEAEKVFQKISLTPGSQAVLCSRTAFCYSALLHQQLPVTFGTNVVLQQARAQHILKTYIPPYLLLYHLYQLIMHQAQMHADTQASYTRSYTVWEHSSSNHGQSWGVQPDHASKHFLNPMLLPQMVQSSKEPQLLINTKWVEGRKRPGKAEAFPDTPSGNSWAWRKRSLVAPGMAPAVENPREDYSPLYAPSARAQRELSRFWFLPGAVFRGSALWN